MTTPVIVVAAYALIGVVAWPVITVMLVRYSRQRWPRQPDEFDECAAIGLLFSITWPAFVATLLVARLAEKWDLR